MKVYILKEEDLWSKDEFSDCCCSNAWDVIGVFSSKEIAEKRIEDLMKIDKKNKMTRNRYFNIDEMEMDA